MITGTESVRTSTPSPIVFTSCELLEAAAEMRLAETRLAAAAGARKSARKPASKRREVKVGGKRVKTIDVHAHVVIPETVQMCGGERNPGPGPFRPGIEEVGERRIREMDAMGIDVEVLSINPYWYKVDKDTAAEVVRINNERLAEFCAKYPDRISAFCSVSLNPPLVQICIDKSVRAHDAIAKAERYAVNILRDDQEQLSRRNP